MTTVTRDDDSQNIYTVPVGRCNQQTSVEESKYEEKRQIALIASCESISKKGPSKILEKKKIGLYIVPGAPTLFYQQGNQNSCILSSLVSALHYMGDGYASEYIIERNKRSPLEIHDKVQMHFCRDILMGHHKEKDEKILNCRIEEWHTSTPYDIFRNQYTYLTMCFLIDKWHQTNHCITVCSK